MSAQHTPGPWKEGERGILRGSDGSRVGDLDPCEAITIERGKQIMADRLLQKSAPDLFVAGELMMALLAPWEFASPNPPMREAIAAMRAAMAKATGAA